MPRQDLAALEAPETNNKPYFLQGGGQMGELTRAYDWSTTSLGSPDQWPLSLRTTISIVLQSAFPLLICWGDELLCFYNDAYRASLGDDEKHPALGKRGSEIWPEIWAFIGPLIEQVMSTGEPVSAENQLLSLYRNGQREASYWTFSYSPAYGDEGQVNGVFVACTETTRQVLAHQQVEIRQRQMQNLWMQAPVAIAIFRGENHVIELANEAHLAIWGRQSEQVVGKPLFEVLPDLKGQGYEALLANVLATGDPFYAHALPAALDRTGQLETAYFNFVYQPLREPDGTITGVIVVANEITELVLAQKMAEASEAKLRSVIASAPAAISVLVGPDHILENPNQAFIDILGKGPDINGKPLAEAMPELITEKQPFLQILDDVYATGKSFHTYDSPIDIVQHGVLNRGYYNFSYTPLFDTTGKVYAILDIAIDVTDMVKARQALTISEDQYRMLSEDLDLQVQERTEELSASNEELVVANEELATANEELASINEELLASNEETLVANEELLEANHLLSRSNHNLEQFAYVASHDLQEPLRKIQQFGDLLKSRYNDQLGEGVDYLERMQSAAGRMSVLIRDLLTFSRISTQRDTSSWVSLTGIVQDVLADLEMAIQETQADIQIDSLPILQGDPSQLRQLFQNLLSNALKFRRKDEFGASINPVIRIKAGWVAADNLPQSVKPARRTEAYHRIQVSDNGIGFNEKYLDRIFQVFQRLHGKNEFAGTGIGLAICEKVVINHGGAITATSQPDQGATFSIYIPL